MGRLLLSILGNTLSSVVAETSQEALGLLWPGCSQQCVGISLLWLTLHLQLRKIWLW